MDTLRAYETLRGKFDEASAKTIVEAVVQLTSPPLSDLATKTDLHTEILATKNELRAEIQSVKADFLGKLHTTTLAIIGANLTAIAVATGILLKALGH